jgi:hypothetical protein
LAAAVFVGAALLLDGVLLMGFGYMTLGAIVPAIAGAGLIASSMGWPRMRRWFHLTKTRSLVW